MLIIIFENGYGKAYGLIVSYCGLIKKIILTFLIVN